MYARVEHSYGCIYEVIITPHTQSILHAFPALADFLQGERRRIQIGWQYHRNRIIKFWIWMGKFCICNKPGVGARELPPKQKYILPSSSGASPATTATATFCYRIGGRSRTQARVAVWWWYVTRRWRRIIPRTDYVIIPFRFSNIKYKDWTSSKSRYLIKSCVKS